MGKTRGWSFALATAVLGLAAGGCTHLVHEHEIEGMMDPVNAQLADHETRISAVESDVAGLRNDLNALRSRVDQLANDFGARIQALEECGCGMAVSLPVHFDFDRADVRPVDQPILDAFAAAVMGTYPDAIVTVEGFADQAGSAAYNQRLSQQRARAVRQYLISTGGMTDANVKAVAYGEARLVSPETGAVNPQSGIENRRVTFVLEWAGPGTTN